MEPYYYGTDSESIYSDDEEDFTPELGSDREEEEASKSQGVANCQFGGVVGHLTKQQRIAAGFNPGFFLPPAKAAKASSSSLRAFIQENVPAEHLASIMLTIPAGASPKQAKELLLKARRRLRTSW
jgi:hypothetical protein